MKRPADQTGFHRQIEEQMNLEDEDAIVSIIFSIFFVLLLSYFLVGCSSKPILVGECIDGKVTWSDGTASNCKMLKQSGEI